MSQITGEAIRNVTSQHNLTGYLNTTIDWLSNISSISTEGTGNINIRQTAQNSVTTLTDNLGHIFSQSTTEIAQNLQDLTTRTNNLLNYSQPEVTIHKPEVTSESDSFGTAEKVVVGAAVVVACLAIVGLFLRILGPYFRPKKDPDEKIEDKILAPEVFISKLSSYTNLGADFSSQSSGTGNTSSQDCSQSTGSSPNTDWSDLSGSRSSSEDSEEIMSGNHDNKKKKSGYLHVHGRYSSASLPTKLGSDDRLSAKSSPVLHKKLTDEQMSIKSTQSLEPLRLEDRYRDRWDDQFDPCGAVPRGSLSYTSHPSESRQSFSSMSSGGSYPNVYPTFPIPSKDLVRQIHMDKERRYPSNTPGVRKEKHVRMSPQFR